MVRAGRYLGLDLGKCTGYALAEGNRFIKTGIWDLSVKASQSKGQRGIKFYNSLLSLGTIDEIYVEKIAFGGNFKNKKGEWVAPSSDGRQFYHGLLMLVEMYAAAFGVQVFEIHPGTLKKDFAGHGGAEKSDMCAVARSLGWKGGQVNTALFHDEVDAIALVETQLRLKFGSRVHF